MVCGYSDKQLETERYSVIANNLIFVNVIDKMQRAAFYSYEKIQIVGNQIFSSKYRRECRKQRKVERCNSKTLQWDSRESGNLPRGSRSSEISPECSRT